ncbi:16S rRNA (adenine(1518)-N(6)/adenine(1519)-N(6))-dimethyltransferase RsmA [Robiginitalea sediminis]|uniref:16S rRNA (adenine(1518)-N(6)/adenine(1519)-N(6))- dimethyltransferase RsmA n=1 Tax=Robiginitalea sediminis TaxID=1982593 RepID=UPI000B4B3E08|nr:16S rRNA (adenine(1518)-N(6)/adenine(1519)-N(6))-dimethyltransferase RsmA [Robiginitalea sediminis]
MKRKKRQAKSKGSKGSVQRETGVRAKKHLGQHFLTDASVAARIADTLELAETNCLLEIGPGTGVLTAFLLEKPIHLVAVELDAESARFLRDVFTPLQASRGLLYQGFEVLEADFLRLDLQEVFEGRSFAITGNFPYNISSQILFKLLDYRDRIPEFSGMFQKEVAERVCAGPGSKTYGILSVLIQAYYKAAYCFTVPPDVFDPPPKVSSGVLHLHRLEAAPDWDYRDLKLVVKTAFNQRRKTLRNSLKSLALPDFIKEDAIFDRRPEQLSVSEFIALSKHLSHDTV